MSNTLMMVAAMAIYVEIHLLQGTGTIGETAASFWGVMIGLAIVTDIARVAFGLSRGRD
jgi:uncharacterized membrane protein